MRSSKLFLVPLLFCGIALVVSAPASSGIINVTTGQTLFYDDFEGQAAGQTSHIAAPDDRVGLDAAYPTGGSPGSWSIFDQNNYMGIQVTDHTGGDDPGAFQGTKYLRSYLPVGGGYSVAKEVLASEVTTGEVKWEQMVYMPSTSPAQILVADSAGNVKINLLTNADGTVSTYWSGGGNFFQIAGLSYVPSTWQKWTINYAVGADTFRMTIGDTMASGIGLQASGSVGAVIFSHNGPGTYYLDEAPIPEPSCMVLTVSAVIGLLAYAWRKHK